MKLVIILDLSAPRSEHRFFICQETLGAANRDSRVSLGYAKRVAAFLLDT